MRKMAGRTGRLIKLKNYLTIKRDTDYRYTMGQLTVIIGCMFAQKTTELIRYIHRYRSIGMSVLVINSHQDVRYGSNCIASHDERKEDAYMIESLSAIDTEIRSGKYQMLAIDEAQFFPDLFDYVTRWADECPIHIVVAGLDGTFQREPFGHILCLIPHAEEVLRLSALCSRCKDGTKAMYSKRTVRSTESTGPNESGVPISDDVIVMVGSMEHYQPVCRKHYLE
jgi:thymidine kinase